MDPVLLHLRVNHFPIVLGILGAVAMVIALVTNRLTFLRYAQISLLLAGIFAPIAFFSGREAEEHTWYINKDVVHEHEETGEQAAIALVITGIIAALSFWKDRKWLRVLLLIGGLASAALVVNAGLHGGKVVHENQSLATPPPGVTPAQR